MAHDVFIGHAHKDKGIADAICEKLESSGVKCWIGPRDISVGEDWTKAIRNAIGSTRVTVFVFSENANAAPHIEREIANAFYTGRIIIPFRLAKALPRRDFLFYLGDGRWFDAASPPAEQDLEALTARIKGLLVGLAVSCNHLPPQAARKERATLNSANSWKGELRVSRYRIPRILKRVAMAASVVSVVWLLWLASQQTKHDALREGNDLQWMRNGARTSPARANADAFVSTPHYTFTRLGLWVAVNPGPARLVQPGPQNTPSAMPAGQSVNPTPLPPLSVDQNAGGGEENLAMRDNAGVKSMPDKAARITNRRERHRGKPRPKSYRSESIKGRLTALLRQSVERIKETWNR
jgi:hypothetical protein